MPFQIGHTINKGRKCSSETRTKIGIANTGNHRWAGKIHPRGMLGKKHPEEWKRQMSLLMTGKKHKPMSPQGRINISLAHKGQSAWNKGLTKETDERVQKYINKISGRLNYNWRGGVTSLFKKIRKSREYVLWREGVFAHDNYTDQKTGIRGGKLHPHHVLNFAQYPELRFDVNNGITLSENSHIAFHKKYGRKNNTREQLLEFLNKK